MFPNPISPIRFIAISSLPIIAMPASQLSMPRHFLIHAGFRYTVRRTAGAAARNRGQPVPEIPAQGA
jgi:hypothetical protein